MPRLDTAIRNLVIGRLQAGELQNAVARLYNVHWSTISRLFQRYHQSGSTDNRQRSGRPRITSAAQVHPGTSPEKPDRESKRNSIKCPRSLTNIGTDSQKPSP